MTNPSSDNSVCNSSTLIDLVSVTLGSKKFFKSFSFVISVSFEMGACVEPTTAFKWISREGSPIDCFFSKDSSDLPRRGEGLFFSLPPPYSECYSSMTLMPKGAGATGFKSSRSIFSTFMMSVLFTSMSLFSMLIIGTGFATCRSVSVRLTVLISMFILGLVRCLLSGLLLGSVS